MPSGDAKLSRILLLIEGRENAQLLAEYLGQHYDVTTPEVPADDSGYRAILREPFDLCILDAAALRRTWSLLRKHREADASVFTPFLLIASRQHVDLVSRHLWHTLDDVVMVPVEKVELQARVEMLLRARRLSLELKLRNDDLEAFIHAMTHDLRAPLRTITGFAEALRDENRSALDAKGRHRLDRIQTAVEQMWELIDGLVDFSRIGRRAITLQDVTVRNIVDSAIEMLESQVTASGAEFDIQPDLGTVSADPGLLKIALTNLIGNAMKYVQPGVRPCVGIRSIPVRGSVRIEVQDNGIGIMPENQHRIFTPFVRLHGMEDYPGIGLGLSAARKAADIMGGEIGVRSRPGEGSIFWIDLLAGSETRGAEA